MKIILGGKLFSVFFFRKSFSGAISFGFEKVLKKLRRSYRISLGFRKSYDEVVKLTELVLFLT